MGIHKTQTYNDKNNLKQDIPNKKCSAADYELLKWKYMSTDGEEQPIRSGTRKSKTKLSWSTTNLNTESSCTFQRSTTRDLMEQDALIQCGKNNRLSCIFHTTSMRLDPLGHWALTGWAKNDTIDNTKKYPHNDLSREFNSIQDSKNRKNNRHGEQNRRSSHCQWWSRTRHGFKFAVGHESTKKATDRSQRTSWFSHCGLYFNNPWKTWTLKNMGTKGQRYSNRQDKRNCWSTCKPCEWEQFNVKRQRAKMLQHCQLEQWKPTASIWD